MCKISIQIWYFPSGLLTSKLLQFILDWITGYLKLTSGLPCGKFAGKSINNLNNPPSIKKVSDDKDLTLMDLIQYINILKS